MQRRDVDPRAAAAAAAHEQRRAHAEAMASPALAAGQLAGVSRVVFYDGACLQTQADARRVATAHDAGKAHGAALPQHRCTRMLTLTPSSTLQACATHAPGSCAQSLPTTHSGTCCFAARSRPKPNRICPREWRSCGHPPRAPAMSLPRR